MGCGFPWKCFESVALPLRDPTEFGEPRWTMHQRREGPGPWGSTTLRCRSATSLPQLPRHRAGPRTTQEWSIRRRLGGAPGRTRARRILCKATSSLASNADRFVGGCASRVCRSSNTSRRRSKAFNSSARVSSSSVARRASASATHSHVAAGLTNQPELRHPSTDRTPSRRRAPREPTGRLRAGARGAPLRTGC